MRINANLSFDGKCEEAFKFYEKVLGGKVASMFTCDPSI
jgi:PhnB protein